MYSLRKPRVRWVRLPLVARVAAGHPLESFEIFDTVDLPDSLLGDGSHIALRVKGDSMIGHDIQDGDIIVVRRQETADNGQMVVALLDGGATVKDFYRVGGNVELRPRNPRRPVITVSPHHDFALFGVVVGLYRSLR